MPRRDTLASKHKCLTPINKTGTCRIATKVGTQKDRTREFRDRPTPPSLPSVAFRTLANALFTPYRPELHYMRGPGPKWRAKYRRAR